MDILMLQKSFTFKSGGGVAIQPSNFLNGVTSIDINGKKMSRDRNEYYFTNPSTSDVNSGQVVNLKVQLANGVSENYRITMQGSGCTAATKAPVFIAPAPTPRPIPATVPVVVVPIPAARPTPTASSTPTARSVTTSTPSSASQNLRAVNAIDSISTDSVTVAASSGNTIGNEVATGESTQTSTSAISEIKNSLDSHQH